MRKSSGRLRLLGASVAVITQACLIIVPHAHAGDLIPPPVYSQSPPGVNLGDGSFNFSSVDLAIGPLKLERYHLGGYQDPAQPYFGAHMTHNFDIYVSPNQSNVGGAHWAPVVHTGDSALGTWTQPYTSPVTPFAQSIDAGKADLVVVSGAYKFTDQDGTIYTFNPSVKPGGKAGLTTYAQRVASIQYANGRLLTFTYNSSSQLKVVSDNTGYALVFDYGTNGFVSAACGYNLTLTSVSVSSTCTSAALKVSYGYTTATSGPYTYVNNSFTDVTGQVTTYGYQSDEISCIQPPGYSSCKVSNTYTFLNANSTSQVALVTQQTMADGSVWNYAGGGGASVRDDEAPLEDDTQMTVTDPNGKVWNYYFTKSPTQKFMRQSSILPVFGS